LAKRDEFLTKVFIFSGNFTIPPENYSGAKVASFVVPLLCVALLVRIPGSYQFQNAFSLHFSGFLAGNRIFSGLSL
jgi:hypothetical protein